MNSCAFFFPQKIHTNRRLECFYLQMKNPSAQIPPSLREPGSAASPPPAQGPSGQAAHRAVPGGVPVPGAGGGRGGAHSTQSTFFLSEAGNSRRGSQAREWIFICIRYTHIFWRPCFEFVCSGGPECRVVGDLFRSRQGPFEDNHPGAKKYAIRLNNLSACYKYTTISPQHGHTLYHYSFETPRPNYNNSGTQYPPNNRARAPWYRLEYDTDWEWVFLRAVYPSFLAERPQWAAQSVICRFQF